MKKSYKRKSVKPKVSNSVKAFVKKAVADDRDIKSISSNFNNVPLAGFALTLTPFVGTLLPPSQISTVPVVGQIDSYRIGSKLKISKIKVGYLFLAGAGIARATARLILVRQKTSLGQPLNPLEILEWSASPAGLSQISSYQTDMAYEVLYDKTILYGNQDITGKETVMRFTLDYSKRPLLTEYFQTSVGGAAADTITGNMNWLLIVSDATGTFSFDQKVEFFEV